MTRIFPLPITSKIKYSSKLSLIHKVTSFLFWGFFFLLGIFPPVEIKAFLFKMYVWQTPASKVLPKHFLISQDAHLIT